MACSVVPCSDVMDMSPAPPEPTAYLTGSVLSRAKDYCCQSSSLVKWHETSSV